MFILIGELTGKQGPSREGIEWKHTGIQRSMNSPVGAMARKVGTRGQGLECQAQDLDFISENECIDGYSKKECHLTLGRWFINSNSLKMGTLSKKRQPDDNRNRTEKPLMQGRAARHTSRAGEEKPGCRGTECSQGHSATYHPFQNPGNVWKCS